MLKRLCLFAVLTIVVSTSSIVVLGSKAGAVTAAGWKAGRIIDDMVFTNKNAMSLNEVQDFLNQKVGTNRGNSYSVPGVCDTNGTKTSEFGGGTRAQYGASRGNPAPFTCLKDYWEVPKTDPAPGVPANNYGGVAIPVGAKSAAQLIWEAGQRYNISPKVLLIMIQKESAGPLITDDWPFRSQYTYAMGAHCPDSGPGGSANCDQNYAGFSMQINESARLLRYYLDNMSQPWWSYKKPGINNILWNVEPTGCGGANVNIENKSTAALYTYTPYQPNQAALNNIYGTGDGCSAYGNRNFWRMYNDWFGSTVSVKVTGSPGSVSWGDGRIDVFMRGSDSQLWQKYYDANTQGWGPMAPLNVSINSSPTVTSWAIGRLDVFYVDDNYALGHYWYDNGAWQNTETLGQPAPNVTIVDSPGAVSWGDGRIDIFVRGSDNALWLKTYAATSGGWQSWIKIGGTIRSAPTVSSWAASRLDIFATGPEGDLEHFWFVNNLWNQAESLGKPASTVTLTHAPGAVSWGDGRIDVFGRGSDGVLWQKWFDATGWHSWERFTGVLNSAPTTSSWAPYRLDEFSTGPAGDLQHYWFGGYWGKWESFGQPME